MTAEKRVAALHMRMAALYEKKERRVTAALGVCCAALAFCLLALLFSQAGTGGLYAPGGGIAPGGGYALNGAPAPGGVSVPGGMNAPVGVNALDGMSAPGGMPAPSGAEGLYTGATMIFQDAGGYVLAVVVAFMAGVIITALCIRCRAKRRTENDDTKKGSDRR